MGRKVADCRDFPSDNNCTLAISGEEDEVVILGEVLEEQAQLAQAFDVHEVGVVDDGDEHFSGAMEAEGFCH